MIQRPDGTLFCREADPQAPEEKVVEVVNGLGPDDPADLRTSNS